MGAIFAGCLTPLGFFPAKTPGFTITLKGFQIPVYYGHEQEELWVERDTERGTAFHHFLYDAEKNTYEVRTWWPFDEPDHRKDTVKEFWPADRTRIVRIVRPDPYKAKGNA